MTRRATLTWLGVWLLAVAGFAAYVALHHAHCPTYVGVSSYQPIPDGGHLVQRFQLAPPGWGCHLALPTSASYTATGDFGRPRAWRWVVIGGLVLALVTIVLVARGRRRGLGLAALVVGVAAAGLTIGETARWASEGDRYCGADGQTTAQAEWRWLPPWPRCTVAQGQDAYRDGNGPVQGGAVIAAVVLVGGGALLRKGSGLSQTWPGTDGPTDETPADDQEVAAEDSPDDATPPADEETGADDPEPDDPDTADHSSDSSA